MTVFISHSFENKPEFENVADALVAAQVSYWNPAEVKPGASLRDQLRQAVERCTVCVFVATRRSLQSSWCGAELGAFWGARKPVIVYLAEPSLKDEELPPIVQGDVWERRIKLVAQRAKELAAQVVAPDAPHGATQVGNMTIEQLQRLIVGAVSLAAAQGKSQGADQTTLGGIGEAAKHAASRVLEGMRSAESTSADSTEAWRTHILWVDDRPLNNTYEREAFEAMGISFALALSTQEALSILANERFAAIISDMGRQAGPREGYVLLDAVRATDSRTPFFIYAGSNAPEHKREAAHRGAQGSTNSPQELFEMVVRALRVQSTSASEKLGPRPDGLLTTPTK
jgi:CheY-like chemotaxis protein